MKVTEKILEKLRKLIRLRDSAKKIGSEAEAEAAILAINRLLIEYNISLDEVDEKAVDDFSDIQESDRLDCSDPFRSIWKHSLLSILAEHNFCKSYILSGSSKGIIVGN